jgi:uncharacterized SAM-binding protein YcdF (DUF218 family)
MASSKSGALLLRKLLIVVLVVLLVGVGGIAWVYRAIPTHNTNLSHFDTLIVLGMPANPDGTPSPEQRERTLEGVREWKAGVAPYIIMTGGAAHNQFLEGHVMAELATAQGVPASAVLEEDQAMDTIQNIYYSDRIMKAHGWTSAEVISSPSHLPRTGLILEHYSFAWRTHASPWPVEYAWWRSMLHYWVESVYCLKLRVEGFPASRFLPHGG